jgi:hypothetical protein
MTFDMNEAWREASRMVRANAQVLAIIAGVFFFLPTFTTEIFAPMPEPAEGLKPQQYLELIATYYGDSALLLFLVGVAQAIGMLALLALLSDRRPTVGEALKAGAASLLPYIGAQILVVIGFMAGAGILVALGTATGSVPVAVVLAMMVLPVLAYVWTKVSLVAPVMVIDGIRGPIRALARSWMLTRGNSFRLFLFYLLVLFAFMVLMMLFGILGGLVLVLAVGSGSIGQAVQGAISGAIGAVMVVYFVAIMASAHRQLSGPSTDVIADTFR